VICASVLVKSGLENRDYCRRGSAALTTQHPSIRKMLAVPSPTSGGRSVGIVRSRTQATKLVIQTNFRPERIKGSSYETWTSELSRCSIRVQAESRRGHTIARKYLNQPLLDGQQDNWEEQHEEIKAYGGKYISEILPSNMVGGLGLMG
jgi:hypothetical protein